MENLDVLFVFMPFIGSLVYQCCRKSTACPVGLALPPGPPALPFLGNTLDISRDTPWLTYTTWAKQYGPIVYVSLLGKDIVIINSEELIQELIERRSSIYNDRPQFVTNEFFGLGFSSAFLPYGDTWRIHRRLLHQTFRTAAISNMYPVFLRKQRLLVQAIVDSPNECLNLLHEYIVSVTMAVIYGYDTQPKNDRLVHGIAQMMTLATRAILEWEAIASIFPIVKYIPTWMPGSRFRRDGLQCQAYSKKMLEDPFEYTMNEMASGNAPTSMVADLLSLYEAARGDDEEMRKAIKESSSTALGAAYGTTDATFLCLVLAMVLYPDVQCRARAEIDRVIGMDRLPDFNDRPSLPYADAVLREVWRWNPVSPLGVPHATNKADVYNNYYIPEGAVVMVNIWGISRSNKYPDPDTFRPERFLSESGTLTEDNAHFIFGAGRRKCVGRHFADTNIWLTMVTLLSCFEFTKVHKDWGIEDVEWSNGVTKSPLPFPLKVTVKNRANIVLVDYT